MKQFVLHYLIHLYNIFNDVLFYCIGYSLRDGWCKRITDFNLSAHRFMILLRQTQPVSLYNSLSNFALQHKSREDPVTAILHNDNVSLMGITPKEAYFAVVPFGIDVYDSEVGPFTYSNQFKHAVELITMPLVDFVALGQVAGLGGKVILLLSNTSRCGSTLLTSMLARLNNTMTASEPDFINHISLYGDTLSVPVGDALRAGFALQSKSFKTRSIDLFIMKTRGYSAGLIPTIHRACPEVKHAFMFRAPLPNIASIIGMHNAIPRKTRFPMMAKRLTLPGSPFQPVIDNLIQESLHCFEPIKFTSATWALIVLCFKESKLRFGVDIFPVSYENLIKDPEGLVGCLVRHCQIKYDDGDLKRCTQMLEKDSQSNTLLSRDNLKKFKKKEFTPEEIRIINDTFRRLGLPTIDNYMSTFQ